MADKDKNDNVEQKGWTLEHQDNLSSLSFFMRSILKWSKCIIPPVVSNVGRVNHICVIGNNKVWAITKD